MVKPGDVLAAVNGVDTLSMPHDDVRQLVCKDEPMSVTFRTERSTYKLHSTSAKMTLSVQDGQYSGYLRVRAERGVPKLRRWHMRYFVLRTVNDEWKLQRFHSEAEFKSSGGVTSRFLPLSLAFRVAEVVQKGNTEARRFNLLCMSADEECAGQKVYKFQVRQRVVG